MNDLKDSVIPIYKIIKKILPITLKQFSKINIIYNESLKNECVNYFYIKYDRYCNIIETELKYNGVIYTQSQTKESELKKIYGKIVNKKQIIKLCKRIITKMYDDSDNSKFILSKIKKEYNSISINNVKLRFLTTIIKNKNKNIKILKYGKKFIVGSENKENIINITSNIIEISY